MFINVGYVIGLLPVTGIQLPLISAGGTSTATTLFMIGLMANAARNEPDAVAALRAGRDDRMNRLLRLPVPSLTCRAGWRHCATGYAPGRVATHSPVRPGPQRPVKPARAAKSGKPQNGQAENRGGRRPDPQVPGACRPAQSGDGACPVRRSGHHGGASQQRRAAAAQGNGRHGNGRQRRSRATEGKRYG